MFWYVFGITLTVGAEELIKAFIVLLFFETKLRIPSLFIFAIIEALYFSSAVYAHNLDFGLTNTLSIIATIFMLVGSTSFHVLTSFIYLNSRFKWTSILFMTLLHSSINLFVYELPSLNVILYNTGTWVVTGIAGIIIHLYYRLDRYFSERTF